MSCQVCSGKGHLNLSVAGGPVIHRTTCPACCPLVVAMVDLKSISTTDLARELSRRGGEVWTREAHITAMNLQDQLRGLKWTKVGEVIDAVKHAFEINEAHEPGGDAGDFILAVDRILDSYKDALQ